VTDKSQRQTLFELYSRELGYLTDSGREFASRYPDLAWFTGRKGADPSVERLLQGVAFLNASIRARFDEEQVEIAQDLTRVLFPQALRPTPAMVIQQFLTADQETQVRQVPSGAEVASAPVSLGDGASEPCRFTTTAAVVIPPLRVADARVIAQDGRSTLRIQLRLAPGLVAAKLAGVQLPELRLYLAGEDSLPADLLLYLLQRRAGAPRIRDLQSGQVVIADLPVPRSIGFEPEEALLPGWATSVEGYRHLFELFACPARFHFVGFPSLGDLTRLGSAQSFALEVPFDEPFPEPQRVHGDTFRLGCVPAVNHFRHDAEPVRREPYVDDYLIIPSGDLDRRRGPGSAARSAAWTRRFEVFSVEGVSGKVLGQDLPRPYRPLLEVSAAGQGVRDPSCLWYHLRLRENPAMGSFDPWLVLSAPSALDKVEVIRLDLRCTNGRLPRELGIGDVSTLRASVPSGMRTRNLTVPTASIPPPLGRRLAGRLVGQLALGRGTLSTREGLLAWLDLFNLRALDDERAQAIHQRRCDAISRVRATAVDRPVPVSQLPWSQPTARPRFGDALVRGVELRLDVRQDELGAGDAFLFGLVLDRVLASQATIGTWTRLSIADVEGRRRSLEWTPRIGRQPLI